MLFVHFRTNKWNTEGWIEIWGNVLKVANIFTYYLIRDIYLFTHPHVSPNLCFVLLFFGSTKDDVQAALLLTMNVSGDYWMSKLKRIKHYLESINELYYKSSEELADRLWKSSNIVYKSYA